MTEFITKALIDRPTGLSLHYPFLHAAVVGLNARRTLEFGAGGSTRVFLDALPERAVHLSISMETMEGLRLRYGISSRQAFWAHTCGKSEDNRQEASDLDIVLHDGSHAADVVAADIAWVWPHLNRFGLLLVHDSQHS